MGSSEDCFSLLFLPLFSFFLLCFVAAVIIGNYLLQTQSANSVYPAFYKSLLNFYNFPMLHFLAWNPESVPCICTAQQAAKYLSRVYTQIWGLTPSRITLLWGILPLSFNCSSSFKFCPLMPQARKASAVYLQAVHSSGNIFS